MLGFSGLFLLGLPSLLLGSWEQEVGLGEGGLQIMILDPLYPCGFWNLR